MEYQKPKRYEDMGMLELQQTLEREEAILKQQYKLHIEMPYAGLSEQLQRISYKISLIKVNMQQIDPSLFNTECKFKELVKKELGQEKYDELIKQSEL